MIGRRYSKVLKNICEKEKISLEAKTFGVACISSIIAIDATFRTIMNQSDNKSTVSASFTIFFFPLRSYLSSTSSSDWKILRRVEKRNYHYDVFVFCLLIITSLNVSCATRLRFNNLLVSLMITSLLIYSRWHFRKLHIFASGSANPTHVFLVIYLALKRY